MFKELHNFGKWLNENNQVSFGKNVKEDDYIFEVSYKNNEFNLEAIKMNSDGNYNYFNGSCFNNDFYHSTDQKLIIPSKSNLLGFTPFFIKLDHKFMKKGKIDQTLVNKFTNKIIRSIKSNSNNKEFSNIINQYFDDFEETYLNKIPFTDKQKENFIDFHGKISKKEFIGLIVKYYTFILDNSKNIIEEINKFKESDDYKNRTGDFYLACIFGDYRDLCNDYFYYYSMFLQSTSKKLTDYEEGICSICGNNSITYPPLPYYSIEPITSFNYSANMKNSKLRVCKNCSSFIKYAEDKLSRIMNVRSILIVPKIKTDGDYSAFLKIANENINSFEKINEFLNEHAEYNFDLLIVDDDKTKGIMRIKKYIENYNAFLVRFENLNLYDNSCMNYLFNEKLSWDDSLKSNINNTFNFEHIFKEYFWELNDDGNKKLPNLYHFYEIYTKDLTGKTGIFSNFTSKTVSIFSKYCENIFRFIYEIKLDALNKKMLNEIVLNSVEIFQKESYGGKSYRQDILKRLNSYFMLKKEFLSDKMLKDKNVVKLKEIFGKQNINTDDKKAIKELIKKDIGLKYYLLGQFISYIEIFKYNNDKNNEVFSNFITNVNRNNIRKLFISEVLQKNNYYIKQMSNKGKSLFEIFEMDVDKLFNEEKDFDYEDYILLMFTGYYTENILKK